jgi:hypothetical protein
MGYEGASVSLAVRCGRTWDDAAVGMFSVMTRAALAVLCGAALAGCESARFGGRGLGPAASAARPAPAVVAPEPPTEALPSGSVTSEPLPPPPGSGGASGPVLADVPRMPGSPGPIETMTPAAPAPVAAAPSGGSRASSVGGWTARDATGATCRVNLSSAPALDLYRATSSGCVNSDLARVTAWDYRSGEVYLYQPGGAVAARLRSAEGSLSGVLAKSGAPLTLTR